MTLQDTEIIKSAQASAGMNADKVMLTPTEAQSATQVVSIFYWLSIKCSINRILLQCSVSQHRDRGAIAEGGARRKINFILYFQSNVFIINVTVKKMTIVLSVKRGRCKKHFETIALRP